MDQSSRRRMSREKTESILKVVVKHFFIEKEVTPTLVMDSLYSGLKSLEGHNSKVKKSRGKYLEAEELPVPIAGIEKDTFVLVDDGLLLLERAAIEPLPPKDEKGPQNRTKELEWKAAQSTEISVDLVSAAERQLKFLATVDRSRCLYEGPGLDRAIYRYNAYWLPLLEKHSESPLTEGPLVVPLDCEWVWHCHRLNPVRYKQDCEDFYGRILDNQNVVSSLEGTSVNPTLDIWKSSYPGEPYELDIEHDMSGERVEKCTKYDLISAVHRQSPFFYQVLRPHMNDIRYIEGAVARYKGFLHLIKRNKEKNIKSFSVPTYDIDLIWHTHQLHPVSYCKDLVNIMGKILEHDDTDSDRSNQKLDCFEYGRHASQFLLMTLTLSGTLTSYIQFLIAKIL